MCNTSQKPDARANGGREGRALRAVKVKAELERIERRADHECIPMDIFVNPMTMREHFQYSSLLAERPGNHRDAAR